MAGSHGSAPPQWDVQLYGLGPRTEAQLNARGRRRIGAACPSWFRRRATANTTPRRAATPSTCAHRPLRRLKIRRRQPHRLLLLLRPDAEGNLRRAPAGGGHSRGAARGRTCGGLLEHAARLPAAARARQLFGNPAGGIRHARRTVNAPAELRERAEQLAGAVNRNFRKDLVPLFLRLRTGDPRPRACRFSARWLSSFPATRKRRGQRRVHARRRTADGAGLRAGGRARVYLPQGIWTRLDTNETFRGRQTIQVKGAGLPVFARNGSIVPLARSPCSSCITSPSSAPSFSCSKTTGATTARRTRRRRRT